MTASKPSFLSQFLAPLTGADMLSLEKARLEAFCNAFPGEYCGFHEDGSTAYSDGFCDLLGLSKVKTIEDVQAALTTSDLAVLEGLYLKLEEEKKGFTIVVQLENMPRLLRLRGAFGAAIGGGDQFRILWVEDVTDEEDKIAQIRKARGQAETGFIRRAERSTF